MSDEHSASKLDATSVSDLNMLLRNRWIEDGRITAEVDVIVATVEFWQSRQESNSPLWLVTAFGGFVVAVRRPLNVSA